MEQAADHTALLPNKLIVGGGGCTTSMEAMAAELNRVPAGRSYVGFFVHQEDASKFAERLAQHNHRPYREIPLKHGFLVQNTETGAFYDAMGPVVAVIVKETLG